MNKKGAEKLISLWWIFVLLVIGGAIVLGVLIYYDVDINIKEFEADILGEKISRCLVDNGYLLPGVLEKGTGFDIFKECSLKEGVFAKASNFYFKISIQGMDGTPLREDILGGDSSIEQGCKIEQTLTARRFPRCSEKNIMTLYAKDGEIKKARLIVLAGSNQVIKQVTN